MRITSSLAIRKLLSSIHPPLSPQSPRESKQLLNVLESAFQRRLDEVHPSPKTVLKGQDTYDGADTIPDPAHRVTHSTQAHLDTILGHPLFNQPSTTFLQRHSLADSAVKTFDDALREHGADTDLVQACCLKYLEGVSKRGKCPDDRKLGPRLARWFYGLAGGAKKTLLLDEKSMEPLVCVMYADGREGDVWQWLQVLYERSFGDGLLNQPMDPALDAPRYARAEDRLVSLMIRETARRRRLQEAMQLYIQAYEYRWDRQPVASGVESQPTLLQRSWRQIAGAVLTSPSRRELSVPAKLYATLMSYGVSIEESPFDPVFLKVYDPSKASAVPLYHKLKNSTFAASLVRWQSKTNRSIRRVILVSILDAAELSLQQNLPNQARDLLQISEKTYPDFLRSHEQTPDPVMRLQLARKDLTARFKDFRSSSYGTGPGLLHDLG
jgi:hypothetical protein